MDLLCAVVVFYLCEGDWEPYAWRWLQVLQAHPLRAHTVLKSSWIWSKAHRAQSFPGHRWRQLWAGSPSPSFKGWRKRSEAGCQETLSYLGLQAHNKQSVQNAKNTHYFFFKFKNNYGRGECIFEYKCSQRQEKRIGVTAPTMSARDSDALQVQNILLTTEPSLQLFYLHQTPSYCISAF